MKHDFKKMEEEMDKLAANMSTITEFSEKITGTLQGKRQQITKLSGVHALLKKVLHACTSVLFRAFDFNYKLVGEFLKNPWQKVVQIHYLIHCLCCSLKLF